VGRATGGRLRGVAPDADDLTKRGRSHSCRIRDNSSYDVERATELTDADRAAGVVSDEVVVFGRSKGQTTPDHPVRIVTMKATPHSSRGKRGGGSTGPNCDGSLRIATNRLRWMIETFFRMFKQLLGCDCVPFSFLFIVKSCAGLQDAIAMRLRTCR